MRLLHKILPLLLFPVSLYASRIPEYDQQTFIETYAKLAVEEMRLYGVPASITIAQAIVESGWGRSRVATEGRNFFCIKCFNGWEGPYVKAMDDERDSSCFRQYENVEKSFRDHSIFLRSNSRYKELFQYEVTDYKSWALGLKKCGYATKDDYADQLIFLIESYALYLYDYAVPVQYVPTLDSASGHLDEDETGSPPLAGASSMQVEEAPAVFGQAPPSPKPAPPHQADMELPAGPVLSVPAYRLGGELRQPIGPPDDAAVDAPTWTIPVVVLPPSYPLSRR